MGTFATLRARYRSAPDALTSGDVGEAQVGSYGALKVQLSVADSATAISSGTYNADANASPSAFAVAAYQLGWNGATWDRRRVAKPWATFDLSASASEQTIWTPTTGKKFRLTHLVVTPGANTKLTIRDNTGGTVIAYCDMTTNSPWGIPFGAMGYLSAAANNVLTITSSANTTLRGFAIGTEE